MVLIYSVDSPSIQKESIYNPYIYGQLIFHKDAKTI